jgi:hypothetical protein
VFQRNTFWICLDSETPGPSKRHCYETRPFQEVRYDGYNQLPSYAGKKENSGCKMEDCKSKTHIFVTKCKVHLNNSNILTQKLFQ